MAGLLLKAVTRRPALVAYGDELDEVRRLHAGASFFAAVSNESPLATGRKGSLHYRRYGEI